MELAAPPFPAPLLLFPRIEGVVVILLLLLRFVDEEAGLRRLPVEPKLLAATTRFPEERGSGNDIAIK